MRMVVRRATIKDAKIANEFLTKIIQDEKKYDKNINENCVVNYFYENVIPDGRNCVLLAEKNDAVVGYLYGYIKNNGDAYLKSVAILEAIFVDESARKNGIANMLIKEFEKYALENGVSYIELKVCNGNEAAISLYKKNQFHDFKTIMMKELEI